MTLTLILQSLHVVIRVLSMLVVVMFVIVMLVMVKIVFVICDGDARDGDACFVMRDGDAHDFFCDAWW